MKQSKMKKITVFLLAVATCSLGITAQTAPIADNVKFSKVAAPVTNQGNQGNRPAGEFYHATYTGAAWGDYDNDGNLDVFYSDRNTHLSDNTVFGNLYHNNGQGGFTRILRSPIPSTAFSCPVWADVNNDGNLDMIISGLSNWYYGWNDNGDNADQIKAHLCLGNGDGTFEEVTESGLRPIFNGHTGGKGHNWISAADYDHDGYVDIVMTGFDDVNRLTKDHPEDALRAVYLYRNVKGERFEYVPTPLVDDKAFNGLTDGSAVFCDLDNDGWVDLFTTGYSVTHNSEGFIYWNNGDGTFTQGAPLPVWALTNASSSVADLDNDGLLDLVLTGIYVDTGGKYFYICKNNGDRTFTAIDTNDTFEGIDGGQLAFGDVNQDGLTDILVGGHGRSHEHTTWLYINNGDFNFAVYGAFYNDPFGKLGSFSRVTHGTHHLIDYDNDGYLDAWYLGWSNGGCGNGCLTELYHNDSDTKGIPANANPGVPTGLIVKANNPTGMVEFAWQPGSDDFTPATALRYNIYVKNLATNECMMLVPANPLTGFLKVSALNAALQTLSYQMHLDKGNYEWGVQAIDNGNRGSLFATSTFSVTESGIDRITNTTAAVRGSKMRIDYQLNGPANITVYNALGTLIDKVSANGSGTITVPTQGIYLVTVTEGTHTQTYKLAL